MGNRFSKEEYINMKKRDMAIAVERVAFINESKDPTIKYKESRPIMDLKHMLESSTELYGDNTAFMVKEDKKGPYKSITYKQALQDVNALGTAFLARGLDGARIAVVGENSYQWAISYLATVCGTGVVVPLDKELSAKDMEQLIISGNVKCVVFQESMEDRFVNMAMEGSTPLEILVSMEADESDEAVVALKDLLEEGKTLIRKGNRDFLDAQIVRDELSVLLFTSGTTGASKGVMLSHGNLVENLMAAPTVLRVTDKDIFFSILPVHHTYECTCGFLMPLYKGSAIAYCEGLKHIQKNLAEVSPTMLLGVPLIFESLYKKIWGNVRKQGKEKALKTLLAINRNTKKVGLDISKKVLKDITALFGGRMRMLICGGAAINPEILEGFKDFGIMAVQGYGLTECGPLGALNPDTKAKSASAGRAIPGFGMKIASPDEDGIGEVCLSGGNIMLGYYNNPEATAEVIKDGWYYTGDLGYIDKEGYLFITGRKKNVIITKNGKNVFPEELEYLLSNSPYVAESMVWGSDTKDGDDTLIIASILPDWDYLAEMEGHELKKGDKKEMKAVEDLLWKEVDKINQDLPFFKKIKKISVRTEEFEKNTSKKIKRFAETNKN